MTRTGRSASGSARSAPELPSAGCFAQLEIEPGQAPDSAVHHGGPVEPGRGFILHSEDWGGQDTLHVAGPDGPLFAMTGTIDVLRAITEGRGPLLWIAALGYAGWGEGQLDEEMTRHGRLPRARPRENPVRHPDRRALDRSVQGRRHRPAASDQRDRRGLAWHPVKCWIRPRGEVEQVDRAGAFCGAAPQSSRMFAVTRLFPDARKLAKLAAHGAYAREGR